jgi:calcineurin-like phosphoesterase family protein
MPFSSSDEMDRVLIENWNKVVKPEDSVYHLGDMFFCYGIKAEKILEQLNGNIFLIQGNHEKTAFDLFDRKVANGKIVWIRHYFELKVNDNGVYGIYGNRQEIILCHYAFRVWNKSHYGAWNLYGHSHGTLPDDPESLQFDVGIDSIARSLTAESRSMGGWKSIEVNPECYRPISYDEVKSIMGNKKWKPKDHHGGE